MGYALMGIPLGLVMFQSIGERLNTFVEKGLRQCKKCFKSKTKEVSVEMVDGIKLTLIVLNAGI